jgi:chromosome partitioning protein
MSGISKHMWLSVNDLGLLLNKSSQDILIQMNKMELTPDVHLGRSYVRPESVRAVLTARGYSYPRKVISFQMLKGGVAKTTSCLNVGLRAAQYGARVLFVDLDQQANLSFALGVDDLQIPVFVDVIEKKVTFKQALLSMNNGISLLPSNLNNSVVERILLQSYRNLANVVRVPLAEVLNQFDLVVIDTAPSLSGLNTAVTCASDMVVLPVNPDKFTFFGLQKHLSDLDTIRREFNIEVEEKILFTKFDVRESASPAFLEQAMSVYGPKMLDTYVRLSADIKNTLASGKTVFETKGYGKEDYDLVARELMGLW